MQRLDRVIAEDNEALSLHALGGKTGRCDVALIREESLALVPAMSCSVVSAADSDAGDHLALAGERHAAAHRGVSTTADGEEG